MAESRFVYVIYIRTTPERLWRALREPEFTRQFWSETVQESTWEPGASWQLRVPDGRVFDSGEVLEIEPHRRLVLRWRHQIFPEAKAEGDARLTIQLEPGGDSVKLTLIHEMDRPDSTLIAMVSTGWPVILSSLKSLLETGESLEQTRRWPEGV